MKRALTFVTILVSGCQFPPPMVNQASGPYTQHCALKHDAVTAAASGAVDDPLCRDGHGGVARMVDGCLSPGDRADPLRYPHAADQISLGTVSFPNDADYPGDTTNCCVCDAVAAALRAMAFRADMAVEVDAAVAPKPKIGDQPPPGMTLIPLIGCQMMNTELWCVDENFNAFRSAAVMTPQAAVPNGWPTQ